jgi:hypothetical protein
MSPQKLFDVIVFIIVVSILIGVHNNFINILSKFSEKDYFLIFPGFTRVSNFFYLNRPADF